MSRDEHLGQFIFDPEDDPILHLSDHLSDEQKEEAANWDRKFNPYGIAARLEIWVPEYPGCFPFQVSRDPEWGRVGIQKESLAGLVYPTRESCLDAMERYIRALDPWNQDLCVTMPFYYGPYSGTGWERTKAHAQKIRDWMASMPDQNEDGSDVEWDEEDGTGHSWKVTRLDVERKDDRIEVTTEWAEWMPPGQWEPVQWNTSRDYKTEKITSERVFVHQCRKVEFLWGSKP